MREILFRGKRIDNREWIEGSFVAAGKYCCILPADENSVHPTAYPYLDSETGTIDGHLIPVDPSTVGQYTGLNDKNGKKIFEGDIVNITQYDNISHKTHRCCKSKVFFSNFAFRTNAAPEYEDEEPLSYWFWHDCDFEVIGNIYDNPELMEDKL